jgi:hypothetical protein
MLESQINCEALMPNTPANAINGPIQQVQEIKAINIALIEDVNDFIIPILED